MNAEQACAAWVATDGDDAGDGSPQRPFATFWWAMQWLAMQRRQGKQQDITLHVGGGVYRIDRPVPLGRDVTHHTGRTIIRGAPDRSTVLCGSVPAGMRPLPQHRAGRILGSTLGPSQIRLSAVELPAPGCTTLDLGTLGFALPLPPAPPLAIRHGRVLTWACWPQQRSLTGRVVAPDGRRWPFNIWRGHDRGDSLTVSLDPHDIAALGQETDLWIEMVVGRPWRWFQARVLRIDRRRGRVATSLPASLGKPGDSVMRIGFLNAVAGLTSPSTALLDPSRRRIVLADETAGSDDGGGVEVTVNEAALIHLFDARNVEIRDLAFRFGSGSGIVAERSERIAISGCDFRGFGRDAIALDGTGLVIDDCDITDTGAMAIRLRSGDIETLRPGDAAVRSCRIQRWARRKRVYEPAIGAEGVGIRMVGCTLSDAPHLAIGLTGNDHEVSACTIRRVAQCFDDVGAIYVNQGETPLRRGLWIVGNAFCDIGASTEAHAVYLDRASCGVRVISNLFLRIGGAPVLGSTAILANGTSDVSIRANLFMDCAIPVAVDFYLAGWGVTDLGVMQAAWDRARRALADPALPHRQRYPELAKFADEDRVRPRTNAIVDNSCFDPDGRVSGGGAWTVHHADAALVEIQGNAVITDPSELTAAMPPITALIAGRTASAARDAVEQAVCGWAATAQSLGLVE